jgi:hypothetical protein
MASQVIVIENAKYAKAPRWRGNPYYVPDALDA